MGGGLIRERLFLRFQISARVFAFGVAASVGVGVALAGATVAREPLSTSEVGSLALVSRPFGSLLSEFPSEHNGTLFHVVLWPIVWLHGISSAWLRLPSLPAFAGAIIVAGLVGARLGGRVAGVLAALFLALNPFAVRYAQEARMYAFALFFSLAAFWALLRALERPSRGRWAAYAVAVAAVGYSHDFALLTVIAHPALVLAAERRTARREFAFSLTGAALLLAPLAVAAATDWGSDPLYWIQQPGFETIRDIAHEFVGSPAGLAVCALVLAVGLVALLVKRCSGTYPLARGVPNAMALWLLAPFVVLFAASQLKPLLAPRYVLPSAAALCIALALSVVISRRSLAVAGAVGVAVVLGFGSVQNDRKLTQPDWPGVASWLESRRADDQRVVFVGGQRNAASFLYYAPGFGVKRAKLPWTEAELARLPHALAIVDEVTDVQEIPGALQDLPAWVVEHGALPAETQENFDRYLASCETTTEMAFREISVELVAGCPSTAELAG